MGGAPQAPHGVGGAVWQPYGGGAPQAPWQPYGAMGGAMGGLQAPSYAMVQPHVSLKIHHGSVTREFENPHTLIMI